MLRTLALISASAILMATALPVSAQTAATPPTATAKPAIAKPVAKKKTGAKMSRSRQMQATCNFGAKEQKLTGAKRAAYMKRCMANEDSPRGPAPAPAPK